MNPPKEEPTIEALDTKAMRVSPDGTTINVGSRQFKRVVLPSVAVKQPEAELNVLDDYG